MRTNYNCFQKSENTPGPGYYDTTRIIGSDKLKKSLSHRLNDI